MAAHSWIIPTVIIISLILRNVTNYTESNNYCMTYNDAQGHFKVLVGPRHLAFVGPTVNSASEDVIGDFANIKNCKVNILQVM